MIRGLVRNGENPNFRTYRGRHNDWFVIRWRWVNMGNEHTDAVLLLLDEGRRRAQVCWWWQFDVIELCYWVIKFAHSGDYRWYGVLGEGVRLSSERISGGVEFSDGWRDVLMIGGGGKKTSIITTAATNDYIHTHGVNLDMPSTFGRRRNTHKPCIWIWITSPVIIFYNFLFAALDASFPTAKCLAKWMTMDDYAERVGRLKSKNAAAVWWAE